jgi:uncharacterized protein (DUF1015 family)
LPPCTPTTWSTSFCPPPAPGIIPWKTATPGPRRCFREWQQQGVFRRDEKPAYYYWETRFEHEGKTYTRRGLGALVHLEPFSKGVILPHEQTYSQAKADRLELFKSCQAHFSPIYALFPDQENRILGDLAGGAPAEPLFP